MLTRKRFKFNATCERLYGGEIFQSSDVSAKLVALGSAFLIFKKSMIIKCYSQAIILPYGFLCLLS